MDMRCLSCRGVEAASGLRPLSVGKYCDTFVVYVKALYVCECVRACVWCV